MLDGYKGDLLASNCAFLIWWNHRGYFLFCLLPWFILRAGSFYACGSIYNCLLSQERSLGVWELQFIWDYLLPVELFCLVTKIFFLVVHLSIIWHPCPLRRWITPVRGAKIWGSYVHNSLPRFNWDYRSCFHTWKRLVCPDLCILAPLLTQVKLSFFSH